VVLLAAPGLMLGLRDTGHGGATALRFQATGAKGLLKALEARGLTITRTPEGQVLKSPEGLRLIVG
jgi:hypothetical protein